MILFSYYFLIFKKHPFLCGADVQCIFGLFCRRTEPVNISVFLCECSRGGLFFLHPDRFFGYPGPKIPFHLFIPTKRGGRVAAVAFAFYFIFSLLRIHFGCVSLNSKLHSAIIANQNGRYHMQPELLQHNLKTLRKARGCAQADMGRKLNIQ